MNETLKVTELVGHSLAMGIDIEWLKKCPVCGEPNSFSEVRGVSGLDNIPDLEGRSTCLNPRCGEKGIEKKFSIRVARWSSRDGTRFVLPLITSISNFGAGSSIYGAKTHPPETCKLAWAEIPRLAESEYCPCGARNPTDTHYCWNCGKKNRNIKPKPPMPLPYDLEELRHRVQLEEGQRQSQTIASSQEFVQELMSRGAIWEITYCKDSGAENTVTNTRCQRCGKRMPTHKDLSQTITRKKRWWQFW